MGLSEADGESKRLWRGRLRAGLRGLSPDQRAEASRRIRALLVAFLADVQHGGGAVLMFAATAREPDLLPLPDEVSAPIRWVFPKVGDDGALSLHLVRDARSDLARGAYGLLEPLPDTCPEMDPGEVTVALVPGLGFGPGTPASPQDGIVRLGQGGGYYDRLIPRLPRACRLVGVGFEQQWIDPVPWPTEPHDQSLDAMVTETGWH